MTACRTKNNMTSLILSRASASRSSGEWSDDDYDVLADGVVVGRIMKAAAAPGSYDGLSKKCNVRLASSSWTGPRAQAEDRHC
jgi:hypothetical protein